MNYTYLPSSPYSSHPLIVMTTNPASRKTTDIVANPNVSLLVHDCMISLSPFYSKQAPLPRPAHRPHVGVSHRPPSQARRPSGSSIGPQPPSSLASLLFNLNSSAVSSISATIGGTARLAPSGSEEEKYFTQKHLENNTFDQDEAPPSQPSEGGQGSARGPFVAGEAVRVIIVDIKDVRISDYKGTVRDCALVPEPGLVNGMV